MKRSPSQSCPTCGGYARIPIEGGKQQACARCGTVVPPLPFGPAKATRGPKHSTPIRVGMKATIAKKEFYAVGRVLWEQHADDGTYRWEEWTLVAPEGDIRYLEYDQGKWTLAEPFVPNGLSSIDKLMTASEGDLISIEGGMKTVTDAGNARVTGIEGELPYPQAIGDQVRFVEMQSGVVTAEIIPQEGEVEWYRGKQMSDRAVFKMFDLQQATKALDRKEVALKDRKRFGLLLLALSIASFILYGVGRGHGKVVAQGTTNAAQVPEEGQRFGPFHLTSVKRPHRLYISSAMTGTSMWVQAVVEKQDAGLLFGTDEEFWDESGYDEGAWHEWVLDSWKEFRLAQEGDVYVRVFADPETASQNAPISFKIEENVMYPTYFLTFGWIALPLSFGFLLASSSANAKGAWKNMADK
jgi:hypothetical protein